VGREGRKEKLVGRLRGMRKTGLNLLMTAGNLAKPRMTFLTGGEGGKGVLTLAVALRHLASYRIPRPPPLPKTFLEPDFWIQLVLPANRSPQLFHSLLAEDA